MDKLYRMVQGYCKRYPSSIEPYQLVTRLLEQCGKVAGEVNSIEANGINRQKRGEASEETLADEIKHALVALMQITVYYCVEDELEESMAVTLDRMRKEDLIE